jgi:tripartite-type tricarboxylate transporter receptor subunit TctC
MRRHHWFAYFAGLAFALLQPLAVQAQVAAKGPVRIIVGFAAGGSSDIAARLLADKLKDSLGVPVIVENRAGAGGRIAAEAPTNATPDGTTFLLAPVVVPVLAPLVYKQLSYDPAKDFAPVAQVATYQFALAVGPNHPARTVPEFVAGLKANPTQANFGSPAQGSLPHFFGLMIGKGTGIEMVNIPYKGGAPLAADLMGGQIPAGVDSLSDMMELHRGGKIRIIATSGAARSPLLPMVATFKEQGFAAIESTGWIGVYAPAQTPAALIAQMSAAIKSALKRPELRERFVNLGYEPTGTTPEQLAAIMAADTARGARSSRPRALPRIEALNRSAQEPRRKNES